MDLRPLCVPKVQPITMECPVCYSAVPSCKLTCGHALCPDCVRSWYNKSESDPSCPMCREPLNFSGMHQMKQLLDYDRYDNQCESLYAEAFDELVASHLEQTDALREVNIIPALMYLFKNDFMDDLLDIERKLRTMRAQGDDVDYIRYVLEGDWWIQYRDSWSGWPESVRYVSVPYDRPTHLARVN